MTRKALSGSLLPLVVSASLLAGVISLSLADPSSEVRSPRPSSGDLPGNTSLPGTPSSELNTSGGRSLPDGLNSSSLEPSETARRSSGSGSGLTSGVAEEIFKAMSGSGGKSQNSSTSGGLNASNTSSGSRSADNGTVDQGGLSAGNRTGGGGTGVTPNASARSGNNPTAGTTAQERGTLSNLTEALTGLLQNSDTNKSGQRDSGSGSQKDPGSSQAPENKSQSAESGLIPDIPVWLAPALALVVVAGALVAGWRSNVDMEALLRSLVDRIAVFVRSLPDLLRRLTVEVVSRAVSLLERSIHGVVSTLRAPVRTLSEALENVEERLISGLRAARAFEPGQLGHALRSLLPHESQLGSGLDSVWYIVKRRAGLTGGSALTPAEIGMRAKERGAEPETVDEVVDVYRKRTYYPEVFDVELRIEKWKAELGDEDEDS